MDDASDAQHAIQIALQTLKERCQQFHDRIVALEDHNLDLQNKLSVQQNVADHSLTEIDGLKLELNQVTEQKNQLESDFKIVSLENRRLWSRLSNAIQKNETLGLKLNKINDSILQHRNLSPSGHSTLIRSKTFTQDEPTLKVENLTEENRKVSLELQDVSLKLLSTISQDRLASEKQCLQLIEKRNLTTNFINNFAFSRGYENGDFGQIEEFAQQLATLTRIRDELIKQKETLQTSNSKLTSIRDKSMRSTIKPKKAETNSIDIQTDDIEEDPLQSEHSNWETPTEFVSLERLSDQPSNSDYIERICPMCSVIFPLSIKFEDFQDHVENHFLLQSLD